MATVEQIPGERLRFRVSSSQEPSMFHVVDLASYGGNGECDCHDFACRCRPNFRANGMLIVEHYGQNGINIYRTRCKHIELALRFFANQVLKEVSRQERMRQYGQAR